MELTIQYRSTQQIQCFNKLLYGGDVPVEYSDVEGQPTVTIHGPDIEIFDVDEKGFTF